MKARIVVKHLPSGETYNGVWFEITEDEIKEYYDFIDNVCECGDRFSFVIRENNGVKERISFSKKIIQESVLSLITKSDDYEE